MSIERVREYLENTGIEDRIRELSLSSAAAETFGCEGKRMSRPLFFYRGEGAERTADVCSGREEVTA